MKKYLVALVMIATVGLSGFMIGQQARPGRTSGPVKKKVQPANYKPSPAPLSPAIMIGDTLYMSGSTAGDPVTGQLVKGGFEAELRQIFSNLQQVLKAEDMDLRDVVAVTIYLAEMKDYARLNEIYREYFNTEPLPTRSTVAVKELARGAAVELTMTAVKTRN